MLKKSLLAMSSVLVFGGVARAEMKPTKFADVEVKIDDVKIAKKGEKIHTLYITIYDADSAMPRPYGAARINLDKDPSKGLVYQGILDTTNVAVMGGGDMPKHLKIKARLDKDGSAGPDEAGDLVGINAKIDTGSKAVVVIDKAI